MKRIIVPLSIVLVCGLWACQDPGTERVPVPPTIQILEPSDDPEVPLFYLGDDVQIVAQAEDSYDGAADLVVTWLSIYNDGGEQTLDLGSTPVDAAGRTTLITDQLPAAAHTIRATVLDTDDLTADDHVNVEVVEFDEPPTVQITAPPDSQIVDEHDTVNFAATATDDLGAETLDVEWTSDLQTGTLDTSAPTANGAIQFSTDTLVAGEHVITVTVIDDGGQEASDSIGLTVIAENLPPSAPTVSINPLGPDTTDDLECIASGAVDPEGGQVTYSFAWDLNGMPSGWSGQIITDNNTDTGDQWTCWATPADPQGLSGDPGSATVIVGNTLPSYSSVVLTPTTAYEDTVLTCTPSGWYDPDGDPEGALYEWWVGAILIAPTTQTLDGTYFGHFDDIYCVVTPFDGNDMGIPLTSNTVTILNTGPVDPEVVIDPSPLHTDEDVVCLVTTAVPDLDGDAVTYDYVWYRDGMLEPTLINDTVPSAQTELGEEWSCEVQADDGTDVSGWSMASAYVVPYEGDLIVTEIMIDPITVVDEDGEYIEIYNASGEDILLDGWTVADGGSDMHVVASSGQAWVSPGDYFILGMWDNQLNNGGVEVDYEYNGFQLDNGPDEVELEFLGVVVDSVAYDFGGLFPAPTGAALTLDPSQIDHLSNDAGANWCVSTTPIFEWGDFGTPGAPNDSCDCWASDVDGDGFGSDAQTCPQAYTDCDDADDTVHPGAFDTCWDGIDQDCDGIDRECTCAESDLDGDGYGTTPDCPQIDCDDNNPSVYPGQAEVCDGIDNNCSGVIDEGYDIDGDGHTTCAGDCNDGVSVVYPGATEYCDGYDNDCNGLTDEPNAADCDLYYEDFDGDGYGTMNSQCLCGPDGAFSSQYANDCDDLNSNVHPNTTELCNGVDDNCDGTTDEGFDSDGDGHTTCAGDCNDSNTAIHPGAPEICDSIDNDCDGQADEDPNTSGCTDYWTDVDQDGYGVGTEQCWCDPQGNLSAVQDGDCNDNDGNINPGAIEQCNNIDDDCDGTPDDGVLYDDWYFDGDNDQHGAGAPANTCDGSPPGNWVLVGDDCDDSDPDNYPGNSEQCDGLDNDCDGTPDDGITYTDYWYDGDGDGYGGGAPQNTCDGPPTVDWKTTGGDCNDSDAQNYPNNTEVCDGGDNDCDGQVDEGFDIDGDGWTTCEGDCNDSRTDVYPGAPEACDNTDNDCDGPIDEGVNNSGCVNYYRDLDNDGYGETAFVQCLCDPNPASGFDTQIYGDCDDGDASVHPNAQETCDNDDEDCDGLIDEGQGNAGCTNYFRDLDGDGYGRPGDAQCLCDPVAPYDELDQDDCYDDNANARPGQTNWYSGQRGDGSFDYNCDNNESHRWTGNLSYTCIPVYIGCVPFDDGWDPGDPGCGNSGQWFYDCDGNFANCTLWYYNRTQECR